MPDNIARQWLGYWKIILAAIYVGSCPQMGSITEDYRVQTLKNGFELVRGYF